MPILSREGANNTENPVWEGALGTDFKKLNFQRAASYLHENGLYFHTYLQWLQYTYNLYACITVMSFSRPVGHKVPFP